jgi:hypothetical protein
MLRLQARSSSVAPSVNKEVRSSQETRCTPGCTDQRASAREPCDDPSPILLRPSQLSNGRGSSSSYSRAKVPRHEVRPAAVGIAHALLANQQ